MSLIGAINQDPLWNVATPFFDRRVALWVARHIEGCRGFGNCQALGVALKGELIGGVAFHNWCPEHGVIEISGAATDPRWLTRTVINKALGYVFDEIKCQAVLALQDPDNHRATKVWKALGAQEFIIPRLRGRNNAGSLITLTDEAWSKSKFKRQG